MLIVNYASIQSHTTKSNTGTDMPVDFIRYIIRFQRACSRWLRATPAPVPLRRGGVRCSAPAARRLPRDCDRWRPLAGPSQNYVNIPTRVMAGMTTGALAVMVAQPTDVVKVRAEHRWDDSHDRGTEDGTAATGGRKMGRQPREGDRRWAAATGGDGRSDASHGRGRRWDASHGRGQKMGRQSQEGDRR